MTRKLETQKQVVAALEHALFNIRFAAELEQKSTHSKHICSHYQKVLDELDLKRTKEESLLRCIEIL